jgi:hypothetical protein
MKVKERWPEYSSRAALHGGDQPQYVFGELVGWYKKVWKEAVMYVYWMDGLEMAVCLPALEFEPAHRDFGQSDRTACWDGNQKVK